MNALVAGQARYPWAKQVTPELFPNVAHWSEIFLAKENGDFEDKPALKIKKTLTNQFEKDLTEGVTYFFKNADGEGVAVSKFKAQKGKGASGYTEVLGGWHELTVAEGTDISLLAAACVMDALNSDELGPHQIQKAASGAAAGGGGGGGG